MKKSLFFAVLIMCFLSASSQINFSDQKGVLLVNGTKFTGSEEELILLNGGVSPAKTFNGFIAFDNSCDITDGGEYIYIYGHKRARKPEDCVWKCIITLKQSQLKEFGEIKEVNRIPSGVSVKFEKTEKKYRNISW